ncbi:MAG: hypothetical protein AB7V40_04475 [Methyloceanibacter sp.]
MKLKSTTAALAAFALILALAPDTASAVTDRMKRDCKSDYSRYCKKYAIGSEGLRACMSRSIKKVSNRCISALVAGGEMTQMQANRVRNQKKK